MQTKTLLDQIKEGTLPELPVSIETSSIMLISGSILLMGMLLILFAHFINR